MIAIASKVKKNKNQGLLWLTDMGTIVEGSSKELLALAAQLSELPFSKGIQRVVTQINLDDRRDKKAALGDKIESVAERLAQKNQVLR